MSWVYCLSTSTTEVIGGSQTADCKRQTERRTRTEGPSHTQKDKSLFLSLAQADKAKAFRDLSGASAQVHYLGGWVQSQLFAGCMWNIAFLCSFARLFVCLFVCPEIHCKAEAQLAKHGWILLDISSYGKIKKWDTGLDLDKSLKSGAFYICILWEGQREKDKLSQCKNTTHYTSKSRSSKRTDHC